MVVNGCLRLRLRWQGLAARRCGANRSVHPVHRNTTLYLRPIPVLTSRSFVCFFRSKRDLSIGPITYAVRTKLPSLSLVFANWFELATICKVSSRVSTTSHVLRMTCQLIAALLSPENNGSLHLGFEPLNAPLLSRGVGPPLRPSTPIHSLNSSPV